ncbi:hypothetical protein A7X12_03265 [Sphingomonas sp. TDK1]|nr:hypothetical protein A7X12_03265 [Sphingomonas sp. TDK1]
MESMHEIDMTLLQAIGAIENLLALPSCDAACLSRARYQTARAVAARRRATDLLVNAALREGGASAEAARALRSSNLDMRMFYTDHTSAWPTARAIAEWPAYVAASRRLAAAIRKQVQAERDLLYPQVPPLVA